MFLELAYYTELITLAKALPGIVWSQSRKSLHMNAKGKKDRIAPISDKVITMLREYYKVYKPKVWLFEGQFRESNIVKRVCKAY